MSSSRSLAEARPVRGVAPLKAQSTEELFRRDYARLVRAAWMLCGSRETAEDVVQEVFARLLSSTRLAATDDPGSYVYRAVINQLRSLQRRQALERRHATGEDVLAASPPEVSDVGTFLAALSERQRVAVVLRYYCDLPLAEVAALMGCRRGTVSVLLRRALSKARTMKEVFAS